jgi:membrane-associated protease RseP (regulator of RpoE activity)
METPGAAPPPKQGMPYDQIHHIVETEFSIEEGFVEFDTPTFYVADKVNLKQAFLRLYDKLSPLQLIPILRKKDNRLMLQVIMKPPIKPSRPIINVVLLVATVGTTLFTGYGLSLGWTEMPNPWVGAVMFSVAVMLIMGAHEMAHKLTANRHKIEATYPYFIPGLPPLGTFGAVIQEKSLPPNRDSLFDLGLSGPLIGFIATIFVTIIGTSLSIISPTVPQGSTSITVPILFDLISTFFPPKGGGNFLLLHPVAYAGYIGMLVTMLNLMPIGQLDGGHIAHVLLGEKSRLILSFVAIIALVLAGFWFMAILAFLIAGVKHPDPLDTVSQLSNSRKLATLLAIAIFILSFAILPLFS